MEQSDFIFDLDEYAWIAPASVELFGRKIHTKIIVAGEEDTEIEPEQIHALSTFIDQKEFYLIQLESALRSYLLENSSEILSRLSSDAVRDLQDKENLNTAMQLQSIYVPYSFDSTQACIGFIFDRDWDTSHDLGVKFTNGSNIEIGDAAGLLF